MFSGGIETEVVMVFLLTLNIFYTFFQILSITDSDQVNVGWDHAHKLPALRKTVYFTNM